MPEKEAATNNWSSVQHEGVQVWAHTNTGRSMFAHSHCQKTTSHFHVTILTLEGNRQQDGREIITKIRIIY